MEVFRSRLVNGPLGDPALYVGLHWERRALLFDLGPVESVPNRELLKVTDVFISHTHIDHFIGFDHLVRLALGRELRLRLFGPPGFLRNVEGKLAGYTWNLAEDYPLVVEAWEVDIPPGLPTGAPEEPPAGEMRGAVFPCPRKFEREDLPPRPFRGLLYEDDHFQVEMAPLDHGGIPSLGYALQEKERINIDPVRLDALGLQVGPWLSELKRALRGDVPPGTPFTVRWSGPQGPEERVFPLGELERAVVRKTPGQRIAYVTDARHTPENVRTILRLARGADAFFCDAAFLESDEEAPKDWYHLTARQAGLIARQANVRRFIPMHFSPRYRGRPEELEQEAQGAFLEGR